MSHHFIVPTNENGLSLDPTIANDIGFAMRKPFAFTHISLYSHGWWTDAVGAMQGYNRFTIEFSAQFRSAAALAGLQTLNIGIHWPSTLTEDQFSLLNYAQALSFFTMEKRADSIGENCGYALLKLVSNARAPDSAPLHIHLVGHSFGCKVVCKALQKLVTEPVPAGVTFDVALMQAAFDDDLLAAGKDYSGIATIPDLRLLVTRSDSDRALSTLYPTAHRLAHLFGSVQPALGNSGPAPNVATRFGGSTPITVGAGFEPGPSGLPAGRLLVADLSPLHAAHPENDNRHSGHHSDIFHAEIYKLLAAFFFSR
jgi:predicted alpha/beta hydrolase family esterase